MKNVFTLLTLFAIAVFIFGCDSETPETLEGEWALTEIRSAWTREVLTGEDIDFRETYVFNQNGTFIKTNTHLRRQASGTFTKSTAEPSESNLKILFNVKLTFETYEPSDQEDVMGTGMIHGCPSNLTEYMILIEDGSILNQGSCTADVSTLVYRKK